MLKILLPFCKRNFSVLTKAIHCFKKERSKTWSKMLNFVRTTSCSTLKLFPHLFSILWVHYLLNTFQKLWCSLASQEHSFQKSYIPTYNNFNFIHHNRVKLFCNWHNSAFILLPNIAWVTRYCLSNIKKC